jgi:hypothetical protein
MDRSNAAIIASAVAELVGSIAVERTKGVPIQMRVR